MKSQKDKTTKKARETNFVKIARNAKRAGKPKKTHIKLRMPRNPKLLKTPNLSTM